MISLARRIAESEFFQTSILFLILLSAINLGLETVPELALQFEEYFLITLLVSQVVFCFEIVTRIIAHGPHFLSFFRRFWNVFDFSIVFLSLLPGVGPFALVARVLRALRVLRVLSVSDRMRSFVEKLRDPIDELTYAGLVLLVLGYVAAISGHYLFSEIDPDNWGTFGSSVLSVFYLALLQDVPRYVSPVVGVNFGFILFFLGFFFVLLSLAVCLLYAVLTQGAPEKAND